ncbi:hypothetical protein GCM10009846_15000 [Agrococcus versicolor]|uniref:Uncharacterized protein n=1 Tax=Agrococcus versicolor TaxID=501482 RepID=A0ABP5MFF9_9MICO
MSDQTAIEEHVEPGEGHSPAAWTAVIIMLVAIAAGTLFFWLDQPLLVGIAAVFVPIGAIVGWVLARAGYGVNGPKYSAKEH